MEDITSSLVFCCVVLSRHAECLELEELTAISVNPSLLPALNQLLLEAYAILRPKPLDYDQRNTLVDVFRKMVNQRFGIPFLAYYRLFEYSHQLLV